MQKVVLSMGKIYTIIFTILIIFTGLFSVPVCIDYLSATSSEVGQVGDLVKSELTNANGDYLITYNLDGGTLTKTNPIKYNLFTNTFTLNNPIKQGYDFIGWTGTSLEEPQIDVTICKGSSGDLEFTANYRYNRLEPPKITYSSGVLYWTSNTNAKKYQFVINDNKVLFLTESFISISDIEEFLVTGENFLKVKYVAEDENYNSEFSPVYIYNNIIIDENISREVNDVYLFELDKEVFHMLRIYSSDGPCKLDVDYRYSSTDGSFSSNILDTSNEQNFLSLLETDTYTVEFYNYSLVELVSDVYYSSPKGSSTIVNLDLTDKVVCVSKGSDNKIIYPDKFTITAPLYYSLYYKEVPVYDGCNIGVGFIRGKLGSYGFTGCFETSSDSNSLRLRLCDLDGYSYSIGLGIDESGNCSYSLTIKERDSSQDTIKETVVEYEIAEILNNTKFMINSDYYFTCEGLLSFLAANLASKNNLYDFTTIANIFKSDGSPSDIQISLRSYVVYHFKSNQVL